MGVGRVHGLLWVVRELRRGESDSAGRRAGRLSSAERDLLTVPLADLCRGLAGRIHEVVADPRAADACIRFFGLGRLPESLDAIAGSLPRAGGEGGSLRPRRVEQLVRAAETQLAADLAHTPLTVAPRSGGRAAESPAAAELVGPPLTVAPRAAESQLTDRGVEGVFGGGGDPVHRLQVLLRAWADVPDGDQQSAAALLLFESEHGLRKDAAVAGTAPKHREARRRLRRRAHAIVEVALQRSELTRRRRGPPTVDLAVDLLLGPHVLAADGTVWAAMDAVCRLTGDSPPADLDAIDAAAIYAHGLAQAGSPHAAATLGAVRRAVLKSDGRVPPSLAARVLVSTTVLARLHDDPAGLPAAWEALRICRLALTSAREPPDANRVTASALRALQELAELYERFGRLDQAMRTLDEAYDLLRRRGDPDQEEEPNGWLQQLLFSQGMIQRRGAYVPTTSDPLRWLHQAQAAEARSVDLVQASELLPDEWGLSAGAVLADLVVDEVEGRLRDGDPLAAAHAGTRARRLIEGNEAGWRGHGEPGLAMAKSARLTTIRAACRLSLAAGDLDGYRSERDRAQAAAGAWLCHHDVEALDAMERAAETRGIHRLHLADQALVGGRRVIQRSWASPIPADAARRAG